MATKKASAVKRKFTPAQLAAQKLFAQRAKAGALKKRANAVKAPAKVAKPAKRASPVRKRNPAVSKGLRHTILHKPLAYQVCAAVHGVAGKALASFPTKGAAVEYGQAYVKAYGKPVVIVGKGL